MNSPAPDSFSRLLLSQPPDTEAFWEEVKDLVTPETRFLIIDDTTLDKPYSKCIDSDALRNSRRKILNISSALNVMEGKWKIKIRI